MTLDAMTLVTQFSLKTVKSLQNELQLHSGATPLAYIVLNETNIASVIVVLTLC